VSVSMNKAWPYNNPTETYSYYEAFPVCHPNEVQWQSMTFGQIMRGDRLVNSIYSIFFMVDQQPTEICSRMMDQDDLGTFRNAIDQEYLFEIYVDDLPVHTPIGLSHLLDNGYYRYFLANHLNFILGHNEGEVVSVNVTSGSNMTDISFWREGFNVSFSYSVTWEASTIPKSHRLQKQLAGTLTTSTNGLDIHWLAIINSFVLILLISSLLMLIILRVVRSDLSKYLRIPDEELSPGVEEDFGWKLLHADIFRSPPHRMWFCACVGSGAHLFLVAVTVVLVGCFSPYLERGAVLSFAIFGYIATSFTAGYISANLYRRIGGVKWAWNIVVTGLMFLGPAFVIWSILNTVAFAYASTAALPFGTACFFFVCFIFVTLPLTVIGGIVGRRTAGAVVESGKAFPCKTNKLAREIPLAYWYQSPTFQMALSGFLPFSAIYIELHYVFVSIWGTKTYTLYGVLLLAFIMLLIVAATVSVLLTYFHLNSEDHRWWWRSFLSGGSVCFYFLVHCVYYFLTTSRMYGILQTTFFFGYSLLVAWGLFLMVGFVTFTATYGFINYIYNRIKCD